MGAAIGKKPTGDVPQDLEWLIGSWQGQGMKLSIRKEGFASFQYEVQQDSTTVEGPIVHYSVEDPQSFKMRGFMCFSDSFVIDSKPKKNETTGKTSVKINGIVLTKMD